MVKVANHVANIGQVDSLILGYLVRANNERGLIGVLTSLCEHVAGSLKVPRSESHVRRHEAAWLADRPQVSFPVNSCPSLDDLDKCVGIAALTLADKVCLPWTLRVCDNQFGGNSFRHNSSPSRGQEPGLSKTKSTIRQLTRTSVVFPICS